MKPGDSKSRRGAMNSGASKCRTMALAAIVLTILASLLRPNDFITTSTVNGSTNNTLVDYGYPFQACQPPQQSFFLHKIHFVHIWRSQQPIDPNSLTIVTQLSIERLEGLATQCSVWADRIAAVVYLPLYNDRIISLQEGKDSQGGMTLAAAQKLLEQYHENIELEGNCALDLELVVEKFDTPDDQYALLYPFNALRNRALFLAQTNAILLLDADFLPSASLASKKQKPQLHADLMKELENKAAVVLPAFSIGDPNKLSLIRIQDSVMEHYKKLAHGAALLGKKFVVDCYNDGQLLIAASYYLPAQGPTDYDRWANTNKTYDVEYSRFYEPYVIVHRKYVPWYDERFRGYGNDKVQHLAQLASLGVRMKVHPTEYAIHLPHRHSATRKATVKSPHHLLLVQMHQEIELQIAKGSFVPVTSFSDEVRLCPEGEKSRKRTNPQSAQ